MRKLVMVLTSLSSKTGHLLATSAALGVLVFGICTSVEAQTAHLAGVQSILNTWSTYYQGGAIAIDGSGSIYFALPENDLVVKETLSGGVWTETTMGSGYYGPQGIAVDANGNVYIAENGSDCVLKEVPSAGGYTQTVIADYTNNGLNMIWGIAVDGRGNVYIADGFNERVVMETPSSGGYVQSVIPTSTLKNPASVAVDGNGSVYITDDNHSGVLKETLSNGTYSESIVGSGIYNGAVAVDGSGNVYVTTDNIDTGAYEVLKETLSGGSYTQTVLEPESVLLALAEFPQALAVDASGNVYVSGGSGLSKLWVTTPDFGPVNIGTANTNYLYAVFTFDTGGTIGAPDVVTQGATGLDFTDAGTGTCTTNGPSHAYNPGDSCTVAITSNPRHSGTIYGAAELLDNSGNVLATGYVQGTGVGPQVNFLPGTQSNIGSGLAYPQGVAVDGNGNLYVADSGNNRVLKETLSGGSYTQSTIASSTSGGLNEPLGVAVDGAGNVYIADTVRDRVLKETLSGGSYTQSTVVSGLNEPSRVEVDASGNVYIAVLDNTQVLMETPALGGYVQSAIGSGLSQPWGIAVDGSGNVFIADYAGWAVYKETPSTGGYVQTVLPTSGLNAPSGVAVDGIGNVYIADSGNSRVVKETLAGNTYTQSTVVTEAPNNNTGVEGVAVDASGNIYVADFGSGQASKMDLADAPTLSLATSAYGAISTDSPRTVTLENAGNATLSFPIPATGNNPSIATNFTLNSSGTSACQVEDPGTATEETVAPNASCELPISFAPETVGTLNGSLVLTDNNLNAVGPGYASQSIALSGTSFQATPTITWVTPAAINYGTALGTTQLNATASVPGTFLYSSPAGTMLTAGSHGITATFTPTDTTDYKTVTDTIYLTVNQATPAITWPTPIAITTSIALSADQLNASLPVAGSFAYSPAAGKLLGVGPQTLTATFTPTDTVDYTTATASVTLTVVPAVPLSTTFGHFVYTAAAGSAPNEPSNSLFSGYAISGGTGALSAIANTPFAAGGIVGAMAVHPSGKIIYIATCPYDATTGQESSSIAAFTVDTVTGGLTPVPGSPFAAGPSSDSYVGYEPPEILALDPSGKFLYVGNDSTGEVEGFTVNATTGVLTPIAQAPLPGYVLAVGPGGGYLYASGSTASFTSGTLVYSIDPTSGALTQVQTAPHCGGLQLAIESSGRFLYGTGLSGGASAGGVSACQIDPSTGMLTPLSGSPFNSSLYLDGLATHPSRAFLYAVGSGSSYGTDFVYGYTIDAATGALATMQNSPFALPSASIYAEGVSIEPHGKYLYSVDLGNGVAGYSVDQATGVLSLVPASFQGPGAAIVLPVGNQTLWDPGLIWPTPAAIVYGTALSSTQLDATAKVAGTFNYSTKAGAILGAGSQPLTVTFTPTDSTDFTTATATVTINVAQATPSITWATPSAITDGTALSSTQLDATTPVAGTLSYTPAAGTVLTAGSQTLSATFSPSDATDYTTASAHVTLTVSQATPTITWSTPSAITYGTALSTTQLNATASIPGTLSYSSPAGTMLTAGSHGITATFTPTDTTDYRTVTDTIYLTVNQATPTITWATPTAITYGTALSGTQLDATASVPGTFNYSTASGSILTAGSHNITASFYPSDSTEYAYTTASVTLQVNKATPTITWTVPSAIRYGTALGAAQLNAGATGSGSYANLPVMGSFAYLPAPGTVLGVGSQSLQATFTPTDTTDYTTATATVALIVNQAAPSINWATPTAISYGTALGAGQLDATSPVAGSFTYLPAPGTVLGGGSQTLKATFTPADTTDYTAATATAVLTVNKATPQITWATPAPVANGTALSATQLDAASSVPGTLAYTPALGAIPAVGNDTLTVLFTPTDYADYATSTASVILTVMPNPLPFLGNITPAVADAGGAAFTITVNGSGFLANSTVYWGTAPLTTQFVSSTQLTATVAAANIATAGATAVNVQTPAPGGGTSDVLQFEVDSQSGTATTPSVPSTVVTVTAGSTATYSISFPATVTSATATCLNLPAGALCTYSSSSKVLTISTSSTTPAGTYQVTVVFAETVTSTASAGILLPFLLLQLFLLRRNLTSRRMWSAVCLSLILLAATAFSVGCGGSSSSTTTTTNIQSVTRSGVVGITVQ